MRIVTAEQMRRAEARAECGGLSTLRLMENAGAACAVEIIRRFALTPERAARVAVVCGSGNNGGDGFVIARKLCQAGCCVTVLAQQRIVQGNAAEMLERLISLPLRVQYAQDASCDTAQILANQDLIVDALFGTGFHGQARSDAARLIRAMNRPGIPLVSVDIPSGLDCDSGSLSDCFVRADCTVAIAAYKPAHIVLPAAAACGEVVSVSIGLREEDFVYTDEQTLFTWDVRELQTFFPARDPLAHKGDFGRVLCICGCKRMQGAAVLAAQAAVRCGAGLVTAAFPDAAYAAIAPKLTEPLLLPLPSNREGTFSLKALPGLLHEMQKADAVLLGCGLGLNADTVALVRELTAACDKPMILDADGINALAGHIDIVRKGTAPRFFTPHPGEMARLCALPPTTDYRRRVQMAKDFAREARAVLILKGANTVVASPDSERVYLNATGNPGLATGGSGDLLAGMLASLVAQFAHGRQGSPFDAATLAVYLHGKAGDLAAKALSQRAMTPTDCLAYLPELFLQQE